MAREPRPVDGVLAFLDILLRRAPAIVEPCHPLGGPRQVGGDECEADWREGRLLGTGNAIKNGQSMTCYLDGNTIKYSD